MTDQRHIGNFGNILVCGIGGILSSASFALTQKGYTGMSAYPAALTDPLFSALAVCFALLLYFACRSGKPGGGEIFCGLAFGQMNAFASYLFAFDTWCMSRAMLALTVLRGIGQALPMIAFLTILSRWLAKGFLHVPGFPDRLNTVRFSRLRVFAKRHEVLSCMLLLILCWSPYLIAFFPGTVCWDLGEMAAQFFGVRQMDTWHPVFTTWIFGTCISIGRLLHSDNLGASLYMLLQTIVLSYALSCALRYLRRRGISLIWRIAAILFFTVTPIWGGYAQFISKDTLYTSSLLLFFLSLLELPGFSDTDTVQTGTVIRLAVWALLTCLLRSNGLYVILPTCVLALLITLRGRTRLRACCGMAAAVLCALLFSKVLIPALSIRDETASGLYSVCFQQSARILRDHGDTVTQEEYAAIDTVLDAEHLPQLYEPWISDPVKYTFRQYGQGAAAEKEALSAYRSVWLSMLKKYPLTCLEAFFAGNISYYTFQPKLEGNTYNNQAGNRLVFETYELGTDPRLLHTTQKLMPEKVRTLLALFARGWRSIPILGLLYVCALYTWILVGAGLSLIRQKRWKQLTAFLPALLSLGVCMLGPVNDYFRYFLPIVAMTLPLLGFASNGIRKE